MKCLTLQPPREFAVAWSTPGYAPFASYFFRHSSPLSFSPSFSFSSLTIPGNARHPLTTAPDSFLIHSPLSSSSAWHTQLWISSALFHPRRTYFNDSRHQEARRMPSTPKIPEYAAESPIAHSLQLGYFVVSVAERASWRTVGLRDEADLLKGWIKTKCERTNIDSSLLSAI